MNTIEPIHTPPTADEMASRLARVRQEMEAQGLDAYVAASPDNVFYLTNFANFVHERPFILVVTGSDAPRFLVPKLEVPHVRTRAVGSIDIATYPEFPARPGQGWEDHLRTLLEDEGRVGVESTCPLQVYEATPGTRVRTDVVEDVRLVKSAYELGRIAYGCALLDDAHGLLLSGAAPGRSLPEVNAELSGMMMRRILGDLPSTNVLATRLTSAFQPPSISHDPHNFTDVNVAMEVGGPHVSVINCVINGYGAEIERTFFLEHVPDEARRPFQVMMEARSLALELTVPGAVMGDVDRKVNAVFENAGYGAYLLHRTGHGIGVTGHEGPFLADGDEREIVPGMVFTIEPGVYIPGVGGFRHSDTVVTTEDGNLSLTHGPAELQELTLV